MKKTAIKGLIILGIIVLLCVFFSGTLHTITTAKVQTATARNGYLETEITLSGSLQWPETENLTVEGLTENDTLVIRKMAVSAGSRLKEGDLIAACAVSNYESRLKALQDSLSAKEKEALEQERKSGSLMLTSQHKQWYEAYRRVQETGNETQLRRQDLQLEAWKAGVTLGKEDALPEGCDNEALLDLGEKLSEAKRAQAEAEKAFDRMKMLNISEDIITYLEKKEELQQETAALTEEITALRILKERCAAIRAPHAGYVTNLELKAGDQISMDTILLTMTADGAEPVIRLDPGDSKRVIEPGTKVTLSTGDNSAESVISGQGVSTDGQVYADAAVTQTVLGALGGAAALTEENAVTAKLTYKAENATTLIPVTALRGSSGQYYVYTASPVQTTLGAERLYATKRNVTVLGMNSTVASIEDKLKGESIIYMEDRPLSDGCEVMPYDGK